MLGIDGRLRNPDLYKFDTFVNNLEKLRLQQSKDLQGAYSEFSKLLKFFLQ